MKMFNRISHFLMASALVFLSSQVYSATLNISNYAWAYTSDKDSSVTSSDVISNDSFSFEGYTLVDVTLDNGTDLSQGASFTDYTYLTNTQTGIYSEATLSGTINSGSSLATFNTTTNPPMTWYAADGTPLLSANLTVNDLGFPGHSSLSIYDQYLTVGQITLYLSVSNVTAGYFYLYYEGEWVDFADLLEDYDTLAFTSVTTSSAAKHITSEASEYIYDESEMDPSQYYASVGNTGDYIDLTQAYKNSHYIYTLAHDGGIAVDSNAVPEPGMLSLMGLAFLGLAGLQRRRKMQSGTNTKLN